MIGSFVRQAGLYAQYWKFRIVLHNRVIFNGFTVLFAFKGSEIHFEKPTTGKKTIVNSAALSNLVGMTQRCIIVARHGGKIHIGEGCGLSGCTIYAYDSICIGKHTIVGAGVKIVDNDFHPLDYKDRFPVQDDYKIRKSPIVIGEGCFIGTNAILLKGTTLGRNCVVGAGSVVSGSFPDNSVIAGNPARLVRLMT